MSFFLLSLKCLSVPSKYDKRIESQGWRSGESARLPPMCPGLGVPGPGVICGLSLLLVLVLAPRVFLRVLRFSSLLEKSTFLIFNSIGNLRATGLSVSDVRLLCVTCVKQSRLSSISVKPTVYQVRSWL